MNNLRMNGERKLLYYCAKKIRRTFGDLCFQDAMALDNDSNFLKDITNS